MCGVPFHSAESYIAKLVQKGYKVAICEQLEDPKLAKGLVKRDVIRVITPGTVLENTMLDESRNNYICSLYYNGETVGLCFGDVSTGELTAEQLSASQRDRLLHLLTDRLARYDPSEILLNPQATELTELAGFLKERLHASVECLDESLYQDPGASAQRVTGQFGGRSLEELDIVDKPALVLSPGGAVRLFEQDPDQRPAADERAAAGDGTDRHDFGPQRPAEPGDFRDAAHQGEAGLPALGAGPDQDRHGQAADQDLARAALAQPGQDHPAAKRGAGAVRQPPAAGPGDGAAHRHLRLGAHYDPHRLRLRQRPGAAVPVRRGEPPAWAEAGPGRV